MRVLIPIFFNAPMGGLHHHVLASARALHTDGHDVVVVSKSGPFADAAVALGATHIATDFSDDDIARVVARCCEVAPDVVYCHPFASRQIGVAVAEALAVPLVAVWHGMYDDFIQDWVDSVDAAVAVSEGIAAFLRQRCPTLDAKLTVIANGVGAVWQKQPLRTTQLSESQDMASPAQPVHIGFVCRLDEDKQFILDVFAGAVTDPRLAHRDDIQWHIIGDGEGRAAFESSLATSGNRAQFRRYGWLDESEMMEAMAGCDIIIAPGRSALESMALGRTTIAIGSKHYAGVVTPEGWQAIAATNFGGIGSRFDEYSHGTLTADLLGLIDNAARRRTLGEFGADLVDDHFRDSVSQQQLLRLLADVVDRGKQEIPDLRVAYAEQRALGLRTREEAVLTYRRYSRKARETAAKHEAQVARLNEAITRRDVTLAALKRNPFALIARTLRLRIRR